MRPVSKEIESHEMNAGFWQPEFEATNGHDFFLNKFFVVNRKKLIFLFED